MGHKAKALASEHLPCAINSLLSFFLGQVNVCSVQWFILVGFLSLCLLKKVESVYRVQQMVIVS